MARKHWLGIRLDDAEADALERAAVADDRKLATMLRKILVQWLREHGWLKA